MPVSKDESIRFLKFAFVGISGTIIDFGIFNLLFQRLGITDELAKVISFSVAVFNNFFWNRIWTYPEAKSTPFLKQMGKFLIVSLIGLGINVIIFSSSKNILINFADMFFPPDFMINSSVIGKNLSVALATIVVLFWNYLANRFWTFKTII